jgi:uncharacterized protein
VPYRPSTADSGFQHETTDGDYFASLASARYMLLTTFKPDGTHISTPVQGMTHGDQAYFRAWSRSGTVKRLRHTHGVQVVPCTALGMLSYGPPLYATARLLPGEEANPVAVDLARKFPVQQRFLIPLLRRWRWRMMHYQLLAPAPGARTRKAPGGINVGVRVYAR